MENIDIMKVLNTIASWPIPKQSDIVPSDKLECLNELIQLIDENKPLAEILKYAVNFLNKLMLDSACEKLNITANTAAQKRIYLLMKILEMNDTISKVPVWPDINQTRGG